MAFIAGAVIGGLIGAALVYAYCIKEINSMLTRVDRLEQSFYYTINNYIRAVCTRLIDLRKAGVDGLDDLIDILERAIFRWNRDSKES